MACGKQNTSIRRQNKLLKMRAGQPSDAVQMAGMLDWGAGKSSVGEKGGVDGWAMGAIDASETGCAEETEETEVALGKGECMCGLAETSAEKGMVWRGVTEG